MKRLLFPILLMAFPLAATAQENTSIYSDLKIKDCQQLALFEDEGEGGEFLCKGIKDYDVRIWEGDLRSFVGFGNMAPAQCASMQTFGAFNSLGPRVEWRMRDGKPFATILRWLTEANTDGKSVKQNWLVVTKLGDKVGFLTANVAYGLERGDLSAALKRELKSIIEDAGGLG